MNAPSPSAPGGAVDDALIQRVARLFSTDLDADAYDREYRAVGAALAGAMRASPDSVRAAELALARLATGQLSSEEEHATLSRLVIGRLPPEHPHWATWAGLLGPRIIEAVRGEPPGDGSSKPYLAKLRGAHPDPLVRFVAELSDEMAIVAGASDTGDDDAVNALEDKARAGLPASSDALRVCLEDLLLIRRQRARHRRLRPGTPAPDFRLSSLDGDEVTLARYAGSPLLLQFTGTWCGPCQRLLPTMLAAHRRFGGAGLRFLSIALEDDEPTLRAYREKHDIAWDIAASSFDSQDAQDYLVDGVPFLVLIGPDSRVVEAGQDQFGAEALEHTLAKATARPEIRHGYVVITDITSARAGDDLDVEIEVAVSRGWNLYAPSSSDGLPVRLTAAAGTELLDYTIPPGHGGKLTGRFTIRATVRTTAPDWRLHLHLQPCAGDRCLAPETLDLKGTA